MSEISNDQPVEEELRFVKLNDGWNAEPNAPDPVAKLIAGAVRVCFLLNPYQFSAYSEGDWGSLTFGKCTRFRLGPTNDHGWYLGQCRYSGLAPGWGEFYEIVGPDPNRDSPTDWQTVSEDTLGTRHFLFYFRDETFECIAADWRFEATLSNSRARKSGTRQFFTAISRRFGFGIEED